MTFLPVILNLCRLHLNAKERGWSLGTDSFADFEIGLVRIDEKKEMKKNESMESKMTDEFSDKLGKL